MITIDRHGVLRIAGPFGSEAALFKDGKFGPAIQWRTDGPFHLVRLNAEDLAAIEAKLREMAELPA